MAANALLEGAAALLDVLGNSTAATALREAVPALDKIGDLANNKTRWAIADVRAAADALDDEPALAWLRSQLVAVADHWEAALTEHDARATQHRTATERAHEERNAAKRVELAPFAELVGCPVEHVIEVYDEIVGLVERKSSSSISAWEPTLEERLDTFFAKSKDLRARLVMVGLVRDTRWWVCREGIKELRGYVSDPPRSSQRPHPCDHVVQALYGFVRPDGETLMAAVNDIAEGVTGFRFPNEGHVRSALAKHADAG